MLAALDSLSVLIYGVLIMAFFLDVKLNKKNLLILAVCVLLSSLVQLVVYHFYGVKAIEKLYPIIIHLPLVLLFFFVFKKRINLVFFSLFTAYLFTAPRRWIGEVTALFFNNAPYVLITTKIVTSILLLFFIYQYLKPYVNRILKYSNSRISLLTVIPASSYCITYATTVYTEALYSSTILVVGIFSVGFNFLFYAFIIAYFIEMDKNFETQTVQTILKMQNEMTLIQLEDYKRAQNELAIYRHDLRHHLHYLSNCISEKHADDALAYITKINNDIEATYVEQYCENTNINLILSAFVAKANNNHCQIEILTHVPKEIPIHVTDVCVILSNGMENAIHACNQVQNESERKIGVICNFKNKKLMIEICNAYEGEIQFEGEMPISTEENHGLGVKSIIAIVKKYNGLYASTAENGIFTMQAILSGKEYT